ACIWRGGDLAIEAVFENDETSLSAFSQYVATHRGSLYYLLADVVEEDFFQEIVPYVRGKDRKLLLARKLMQRYRDTSLALSARLGVQSGMRRDELVLLSSFTNTQQ